jgi:hypothetical protein
MVLTFRSFKKIRSYPLMRGNTKNYLQKGKGMIINRPLCATTVIVFFMFMAAGVAAKTVKIGDQDAKLDLPSNAKASLVLVPGHAGLSDRDPLQRAKIKYVEKGFAVISIDKKTNLKAAMKYASETAKPVYVAAVSSGVSRLAGAIAAPWFRAQKLVLVSGDLGSVLEKVGSPDKLPPTLVIHHRLDRCSNTSPTQVDKFQKWGGSKVTVHWMIGGSNSGDSCGAQSYHGLADLDDEVVNTITRFLEQ